MSIAKEKRADAGAFRSSCEESGNRDHVETEYSEKSSIRSIWSGSRIGSEFDMLEQESHKSFNTAMEDLPYISEAMEYFEKIRDSRPAYDCSNFVPNWMREAIGVGGKWKLPKDIKMSNNTRRLMQNPVYAKTLRGTVINCLHDKHRELNVSRDIQPLRNPFGPLTLFVTPD